MKKIELEDSLNLGIDFKFDSNNNELTILFQEERMDSASAQEATKLVKKYLEDFLGENTALKDSLKLSFDLQKVSYISSLFLRLIGLAARFVPKGNLSVINANQFIRDLFRTSGMETALNISGSETDTCKSIQPSSCFVSKANVKSIEEYQKMHQKSIEDTDIFWSEMGKEHIVWSKPFEHVRKWENNYAKWFEGGKLNACYNCVDKHLGTPNADKIALLWEGEPCSTGQQPEIRKLTYRQLHHEIIKFANVLKKNNIKKGDRILIYMPMIPESVIAMLACARIGAIHSVVFAGFSPQAIAERIEDSQAKIVLTVDGGYRRGRLLELKKNVDDALILKNNDGELQTESINKVIIYKHAGNQITMESGRDIWWHEEILEADTNCPPEEMDSEDILFILYTSGSTGKPKGIIHSTAGYLLGTKLSHQQVFDLKDEDVYWCTADIGWITGHSYIVYGPLANGATVFIYEGAPDYPDKGRFWRIVERHKVTVFYTAPTAIRAFMKWGDNWPAQSDLSSLRLLGTVGEPINPNAWEWFYKQIGGERCPVVDTWWQTEIVDETGAPISRGENGFLTVKQPWPSMLRGIWNDPERYLQTYWTEIPGKYCTGDGARQDKEGYFWIIGRLDDVINVSGHRIGTAEVESALVGHPTVAEAAAVGRPDDLKGSALVVFLTLMPEAISSDELKKELCRHVAAEVGSVAKPEEIRFIDTLPKTRSGKIMRRFLKQIAAGTEVSGDISTLEDMDSLMKLMS